MNAAYYNEHDPFAAAWLRNLIAAGLIPPGDVDERDIQLVQPADLAGYVQCHFFAGIGGWAYALQLAEWPADRPVWTGSCPCQPFSSAGKAEGFNDPRHLWPSWFRLIRECRPPVVFGEQVASRDGLGWFDTVSTDLEAEAYAIGAADLCAAGVGAPQRRQRLWFVAESRQLQQPPGRASGPAEADRRRASGELGGSGSLGSLADAEHSEWRPLAGGLGFNGRHGADEGRAEAYGQSRACSQVRGLANGDGERRNGESVRLCERGSQQADIEAAGRGAWSDSRWHLCRDGKYRPVPTEPALFPVAPRLPGHVGRLRGSGNSIVPQVAGEFVRAYMEASRVA